MDVRSSQTSATAPVRGYTASDPLFGSTSNREAVDRVVQLSIDAMGFKCGSVALMNGAGELQTVHATHGDAVDADALQYALDEGPCLDAARTARSVMATNLLEDDRWPRWSRQAAGLGLASTFSAALTIGDRHLGSLNLYGLAPDQFTDVQTGNAQTLADMTSLFIDRLDIEHHLTQAIESRTQIGQAQGILMERFDITRERAFAVLRRFSQTHNVKLRDIAAKLVEMRHETAALDQLMAPHAEQLPVFDETAAAF